MMKPIRTVHYKKHKQNCNRCELRKHKLIKIDYKNFPQHGAKRNRVMMICTDCRDEMIQYFLMQKLTRGGDASTG